MKTLYVRAPHDLHRYITILDIGLIQLKQHWRIPSPPAGAYRPIKRQVPDHWIDDIDTIARLEGISRNAAVVAALQYATRSAFNPRPAIPRDDTTPHTSAQRPTGT